MTDEIVNPNKHLIIPGWINEKYFAGVLAKDEPDHVKVLKFTPVAAIPPGENFTSTMLRIHIKLEMKGKVACIFLWEAEEEISGNWYLRDGVIP